MRHAARVTRGLSARARLASIGAVAALLVVLSALYVAGLFQRFDSFALDHWMPGLYASPGEKVWPAHYALVLPFTVDASTWEVAISLLTYPASLLVSFLVFATCCVVLWRRGHGFAAVVWGTAWLAANALALTMKATLARPTLSHEDDAGVVNQLGVYTHTFPSGHALRAVMVAAILVVAWRRALPPAVAWALAVPVALVIIAAHVPADVIGGVVLGALVVVVAAIVADAERLESWLAGRGVRFGKPREPAPRSFDAAAAGAAAGAGTTTELAADTSAR